MHLVLIAYHFPPTPEVGGLRAAKVTRAFLEAGHRVTVIRAASVDEGGSPFPPHPRLQVRTVPPWRGPRQLYGSAKAAGQRVLRQAAKPSPESWVPPTQVSPLKRLGFALMWLPDDHQGFIPVASRAAREAIGAAGGDAVLYSSSPPHSAHLAARLAVRAGIPWVLELRDPWTDNPGKPWYCRTGITDAVERWLERRCLSRADLVVCASEGIEQLTRAKLPSARGGKCLLVRNGIDEILPQSPGRREGEPFRILHLGTFYLGRDPRPFLRALATVVARRRLEAKDLQVEFIGKCEWFDGVSVRQVVAELGLSEVVRLVPWLPHDEAQIRVQNADLLLLLAEGQPFQVPNKLYEYLGSRRPMLVFADPEGETARLVREAGHAVVTSAGPAAEAALEEAILGDGSPRTAVDPNRLEEWTTARQMGRLVEAVETAARAHRRPPAPSR